MKNRTVRMSLTALAAVAALTLLSPAHAGTWGDSFDPIGMHGTSLINISGSDCLPGTTTGGFFYVNGFDANNCEVSLLNASVTLTDLPASDSAQLTFIDLGGPATGNIWGVDLAVDGTLLGVDSFLIGPQFTPNPAFSGPWWIQLNAQDGQLPPGLNTFASDPPPNNVVNLFSGSCPEGCFPNTGNGPIYIASVDGNRFFAVPEPGSLALLACALGAGWLTRRRKGTA